MTLLTIWFLSGFPLVALCSEGEMSQPEWPERRTFHVTILGDGSVSFRENCSPKRLVLSASASAAICFILREAKHANDATTQLQSDLTTADAIMGGLAE